MYLQLNELSNLGYSLDSSSRHYLKACEKGILERLPFCDN